MSVSEPLVSSNSSETDVVYTKANSFVEHLRRFLQSSSLWPLPIANSCCAQEYMAAWGGKYDLRRLGMEIERFSPSQSDLMIVTGTITEKMAPVVRKYYEQMPGPKWVLAFGACACSGGMYRTYSVVQGVSREVPVDVYIPGCPPTPEALMTGIKQLGEKIKKAGASV